MDENGCVKYALWPNGDYCELADVERHMTHMSDDYMVIDIDDWDDNGDPIFPEGLV